jgi:hypothetical protein
LAERSTKNCSPVITGLRRERVLRFEGEFDRKAGMASRNTNWLKQSRSILGKGGSLLQLGALKGSVVRFCTADEKRTSTSHMMQEARVREKFLTVKRIMEGLKNETLGN